MSLDNYSDVELKEELIERGSDLYSSFESHELIDELEDRGDYNLSAFDTEDLQCALRDRNEEFVYENAELEEVYYAMRDKDLEKVIELMNPLLWESIGRKV